MMHYVDFHFSHLEHTFAHSLRNHIAHKHGHSHWDSCTDPGGATVVAVAFDDGGVAIVVAVGAVASFGVDADDNYYNHHFDDLVAVDLLKLS